ncbi:resistance-nodulation-cell division (RND) efflux transporter [Sulfuriferula plumbiphila]|uniref:Resistance-nodulation-cell division (RND) efflux transporter n=1 Tax=Sulfuriferula plumbiphila TaxID=171865 RepID=A0A512L5L9_9PROT|nr:efflux RND transporter permease subunit [Sulfuriferula plumbiphila]BBP03164.1 resistance-nodulation-cell division (RND) efflux transporter [Sulfuriferula plumbiphila]GEP29451.1 resistance-nodulation-cell division (RND) efflux transporter [Sulfuriferula plumbiphila]
MNRFNLSEWALAHRNFVLYLMALFTILGVLAYGKLGQSEDPPFTFKVMLVQAYWPGATAKEMEQLVANPIEKALLESPHIDTVRSFSRPGVTQLFVTGKDATPARAIPDMFYQVRKRVGDIQRTLPQGVVGPFFNDEFGETYGNVFALTGDGFSLAQLRDTADKLRKELLRVPGVAKVDVIGVQDEKIYVELSNQKLANLGFSANEIVTALQAWNAMSAAGSFETATDRIYLRPGGRFRTVEQIRDLPIRVDKRTVLLKDIAEVKRGYADPAQPEMRFEGTPAIGIGVSMQAGGDIIALGEHLDADIGRIEMQLPAGLVLHRVNDQPRAVRAAISVFQRSVAEAVIIVLAVSFFSLGLRAGTVVALSIPLVLAATFFFMNIFDVGLHKISLGALILALGLLVDDAIIAVEMMSVKMEQGFDRIQAASATYATTAFPMLTGTLVTAAGFLPIATAQSTVGEYTRSLFEVVTIALLLSWLAAIVVIPYLGYKLLLPNPHRGEAKPGHFAGLRRRMQAVSARQHALGEMFYKHFRGVVTWCVTRRKTVILITLLVFIGAVFSFQFVQKQFFPDATRLELLVDLKLPEGSSLAATQRQAVRLERWLNQHNTGVDNYVAYVGSGSPRFYLPLDQQLPAANFAQFVITTKNIEARERLRSQLIALLDSAEFAALRGRVLRLENGPPVGFPVQFRISGDNFDTLRSIAGRMAASMRANPNLRNVQMDWGERSKAIFLDVDPARAQALGVTQQGLSQVLQTAIQGADITTYRERDQLIEVVLRGAPLEREHIGLLASLNVPTASGRTVPLSQIATLRYGLEDSLIWKRNRVPTITVMGDIYSHIQAPTVSAQLEPLMDKIRATLPLGYRLETGGATEESAKANASINAGLPIFLVAVLTLLMLQLQSFQRVIMVVLTAPLGLIGVALALLLSNRPFGFVAMLGTLALTGMIMRNSVILIDQIERNIRAGQTPWDAIIEAAVRRFRPIMLTAMAAILAMIPLSDDVFFGPMATAIMGGLFIATVLTLLFLPALYAAWFRVKRP